MNAPGAATPHDITPCLWFDTQAEEAVTTWCRIFAGSRITRRTAWPPGSPRAGQALLVEFELEGRRYTALNGGPQYRHSPAFSLAVHCDDQAETDRVWDALLEGGTPQQCGWLTDRFGVSWQVVPRPLLALMGDPDPGRAQRATAAMMQMVKIDIAALQRAADGG